MPWAPLQRCSTPGCRERQAGPRCALHEQTSTRNHRGVPRRFRGLGADHDRNVRAIAATRPRCELRLPGCTAIATSPEHRLPRSQGGGNDPANIGAACLSCQRRQGAALARAR